MMTYAMCAVILLATLLQSGFGALLVHEPESPVTLSRSIPTEHWIEQPLDHYHPTNVQTWNMRFYYNDEFAPATNATTVIVVVGGEWTITPGQIQGGIQHELASEINAALFYTEHRYYGQSRPTEDTSVDGLRYLNVDQALGDLAYFLQHFQEFDGGRYRNARVGLVGCSYAGSMVTWARATSPHLVAAGFATSGPLLAQEDFPEYLQVIAEALQDQGSEECIASIEEAVQDVHQLLLTDAGSATVSQLFGTCAPLNASNPLDVQTFFWYGVTEAFAYLVQYAVPGTIDAACQYLTNSTYGDPVQRLGAWTQTMRSFCLQTDYDIIVESHRNTSYDAPDVVMRLWTYQTCVEYGWYQTTNSDDQPFFDSVPLEYFHQQCKDFFGESFDEDRLRWGIQRSNLFFGALERLPPRLVTIGGSADPWYPMGPKTSTESQSPVYLIPRTSHCRAMRAVNVSESEDMRLAKVEALAYMKSWMNNEDVVWTSKSTEVRVSTVLVMLSWTVLALIF